MSRPCSVIRNITAVYIGVLSSRDGLTTRQLGEVPMGDFPTRGQCAPPRGPDARDLARRVREVFSLSFHGAFLRSFR